MYVSPFDLPKEVGNLSTMPDVERGASRGWMIDGSDWGYLPHVPPVPSASDQRCGQRAGRTFLSICMATGMSPIR